MGPENGWVRELGGVEPATMGRHITHLEDTTVAEKYLLLSGPSVTPSQEKKLPAPPRRGSVSLHMPLLRLSRWVARGQPGCPATKALGHQVGPAEVQF